MSRLLFTTALAALSCPAFAEEAVPKDQASTIIVTGQRVGDGGAATASKTATDPRDVPAAISVVPRAVIDQQDVRGLDAVLTNASAVSPQFGGGYGIADNYVIRGLPMRFLRDGLPDGSTFNGYRRTLADIASIEVLKGPGSALYGRAEAGGSVNLTTLAPEPALHVAGLASYGRYDSWTAQGDVNLPLTAGAAARLIGNFERSDGFRGLQRRFVDVLPTVAVELGGHRLTFDYDHREQRLTPDNYGIPFTVAGRLAAVDRSARLYSPFNRSDQTIDRFTIANNFAAASELEIRAALVYDRREIDFARNAGGNAINAAGVMTGRNGRTQSDDAEYWTAQAEAVWRPRMGGIAHTVLLGAEYGSIAIDTVRRNYNLADLTIAGGRALNPDTVLPTATTLAFSRRIESDTLSVYGQEQADIGDWLKLRGGVRLDSVKLVDAGLFSPTAAARIAGSDDLVSWQVGAVVRPVQAVSLYAGYARGKFIAVQTEAANLSSNFARRAPPAPESSEQVEIGFKAEPLTGRLQINGAVFETRRDDFFVTLIAGGDPVQVGRQRSRGAELELLGTPLPGLSVIANAAYVDAINRSTALVTVTGLAVNQSSFGKRLAATPELSGALWGNYELQSGGLRGLTIGAGVQARSAAFADALELLRVPGYAVLRAALGYRFGPVEAQLTVANIGDRTYYTVPTFIGALPGEPRSVQLTLRARL